MIAPLDLTTEELEIYRLLYSKMDFETFKVKYTVQQLADDSNKKLSITKKSASLIIKKFVYDGLVEILQKGTKGNPTIYLITKLNEIEKHKSNLTETQKELKGNLIETQERSKQVCLGIVEKLKGNTTETQKELKGNTKVIPINDNDKEIEKEIDNTTKVVNSNKLLPIIDKWNSLGLSKIINIQNNRLKLTNTRLKENGLDNFLIAIDNINKSSFLRGQNNRGWTITYDWLIKPNNFSKVLEGNYNDKGDMNNGEFGKFNKKNAKSTEGKKLDWSRFEGEGAKSKDTQIDFDF